MALLSSGGTLRYEKLEDASCWALGPITCPGAEPGAIGDVFEPLQKAFLLQWRVGSASLACVSLGVWDHLIDTALRKRYCWAHGDFSLQDVLCECKKSVARWISGACTLWAGRGLISRLLFCNLSFAIVTPGDNTASPPLPSSGRQTWEQKLLQLKVGRTRRGDLNCQISRAFTVLPL